MNKALNLGHLEKYCDNIQITPIQRGPHFVMDLKQKTSDGEKTVDCHKKKQEMETNPRSLQSNP
jgi:hypothetical protein